LRLLQPISSRNCHCGHNNNNNLDPFHGFNCRYHKTFRTRRHNGVRDQLATLISTCNPFTNVLKEQRIPADNPEYDIRNQRDLDIIPDIIYTEPDGTNVYLDVTMINSSAPSYMRGNAYQRAYNSKINKYMTRLARGNWKIIPFVVDITGKLSDSAMIFVHEISHYSAGQDANNNFKHARIQFLKNIGRLSMKFNVAMACSSRFMGHLNRPIDHNNALSGSESDIDDSQETIFDPPPDFIQHSPFQFNHLSINTNSHDSSISASF
jgi:hypothetical protein